MREPLPREEYANVSMHTFRGQDATAPLILDTALLSTNVGDAEPVAF